MNRERAESTETKHLDPKSGAPITGSARKGKPSKLAESVFGAPGAAKPSLFERVEL